MTSLLLTVPQFIENTRSDASAREFKQVMKEQPRFHRQLGLRLGTSMRIGEHFSNLDLDPWTTWNFEAFYFHLYYYDKWFEINLEYQPPMRPLGMNHKSIQDEHGSEAGSAENETDFSFVTVTGYPFQFFGLPLGISVGHLHHRVKWVGVDNRADGGVNMSYMALTYQAVTVGVTFRFLNRFRAGMNVFLPYHVEIIHWNPDTTEELYEVLNQDKLIPGFSLEFTAFIFKNLSISAEYYFMFLDAEVTRLYDTATTDPLGPHTGYLNHRIALSVGYGFSL
jgi:hypothetical protein